MNTKTLTKSLTFRKLFKAPMLRAAKQSEMAGLFIVVTVVDYCLPLNANGKTLKILSRRKYLSTYISADSFLLPHFTAT